MLIFIKNYPELQHVLWNKPITIYIKIIDFLPEKSSYLFHSAFRHTHLYSYTRRNPPGQCRKLRFGKELMNTHRFLVGFKIKIISENHNTCIWNIKENQTEREK